MAVLGSVLLAVLAWVGVLAFEGPILTFFGADETLLAMARRYMQPIKLVFPLFLFNQMLAAFLRNDKSPGLCHHGCAGRRSVQHNLATTFRVHL